MDWFKIWTAWNIQRPGVYRKSLPFGTVDLWLESTIIMKPALSLLIYRYDKFCGAFEIKCSRYLSDSGLSESSSVMRPPGRPPAGDVGCDVLVWTLITFYMNYFTMSKLWNNTQNWNPRPEQFDLYAIPAYELWPYAFGLSLTLTQIAIVQTWKLSWKRKAQYHPKVSPVG